jgi:parallel beta-helix repeat protein
MIGLTRRRGALLVVGLVLVVVAPVLVAATSGGAASKRIALSCGDTVVTSVTLTADITGCGSRGLIAGHSGIVINLNGHTISGTGVAQGVFDGSFGSVTVKNGTISGFSRGVEFDSGASNVATGLRIHDNAGTGIFTFVPTTITSNVIWKNGSGIAVGCCASDKSTVSNNVVNSNTGDGIDVSFTASGSVITGNRVLSNTGTGINVGAAGAAISGNTASANGGDGMDLTSNNALPALRATSNKANSNTQLGISLGGGDTDGGGNKAAGNGSLHQCENIVCS